MKYINALAISPQYRRLQKLFRAMILAVPVVILGMMAFMLYSLGAKLEDLTLIDSGTRLTAIFTFIVLPLAMYYFIGYMFRLQTALVVDISSDGIRHEAPGMKRFIPWSEVMQVKIVLAKKGMQTLQLVHNNGRYRLSPYLVPDSPDSPEVLFGFGSPRWKYPDGRTLRIVLEESPIYSALKQYRIDLPK